MSKCYNSELPIGPPGPQGPQGEQGPAGTPNYKVYVALLTQQGASDPDNISIGTLTVGRTYTINANSPGMDFTNVGAINNLIGTSFVATGINPTSWGSGALNVLTYNAGAPEVVVLENTLSGTPTFNYVTNGVYSINLTGEFIEDKTFFLIGCGDNNFASGAFIASQDTQNRPDTINFSTGATASSASWANNLLYKTPIEIRVYP
jgi:hypothetical protein